jgi:hypothetical protein
VAANKNIVKKGVSKNIIKQPYRKPRMKEFKVNGIMAWAEAKKNGFQFYPKKTGGNKTGTGESGESYRTDNNSHCKGPNFYNAQMVGGVNMILHQCAVRSGLLLAGSYTHNSYSYFYLFFGKKLNKNWKIKDIKFTGSYQWTSQKWQLNSDIIRTKIKMTNSRQQSKASKAMLKNITLIGPANGKWQDAFNVN